MTTPTPSRLRPLLLGLMIAAAFALGVTFRDLLSFDTLAASQADLIAYRDAHLWQAVLFFCAAYIGIVALSLPGATIATLAGGFLFGPWLGTALNALSATLGAVILFLAARWGAGARLSAKLDDSTGRLKKIKDGIDDNQWSMLFLIRLVPAIPFFAANLLPALVGVPLYRYVISTGLGILPGTFVYTSVGAGLGDVFARGERPDLGIIFEPAILLPILGLSALALLPIFLKRKGREEGLL